jgi:hypothetical protein
LRWAKSPSGPPPHVEPFGLESLLSPPDAVVEEASRVAAVQGAKLLLDDPPLGERARGGIHPASLWLAVTIGVRRQAKLSEIFAEAVPRPASVHDLLLRHALVAPSLEHLEGAPFAERLRELSPLTSILARPAPHAEEDAIHFAEQLVSKADGWRLLRRALAEPIPPDRPAVAAGILRWRGLLMERLRFYEGDGADRRRGTPLGCQLVLEIYESASYHYAAELFAICRKANRILNPPSPETTSGEPTDGAAQEDLDRWAIAFGRWWDPLRAIFRTYPDAVHTCEKLDVHLAIAGRRLASLVQSRTQGVA